VNHRDQIAAVNNSRALIDAERRVESNTAGMAARYGGTLVFVANVAWFFLSHRLALAKAAMAAGFRVHLVSDIENEAEIIEAQKAGIDFHRLEMTRGGTNPLHDLKSLRTLKRIMKRLQPDIVHNVTAKPIFYGTQAARVSGARGVVNAISGFGYAYSSDSRRLLRGLLNAAYERSFRPANVRIIVQNAEDRAAVLRLCPAAESRTRLIVGSGVDLTEFRVTPEPSGIPTVLLPGRLLREKGIYEFAAAAVELRRSGLEARFLLAGKLDPLNRGALTASQAQELCASSGLEWLGECKDMPRQMSHANIVCLPSYREGAPKALVEACAAGRAVVTTDTAGCREVVHAGKNGLLVPPRDATALAAAIRRLIENPDLRRRMGLAGRTRAESEFGIERVVQRHLEIYRELLAGAAAAT
jgi:glycosyltransferase involved in cell wall biosynthesis